ncbi:MAG TPA: NACHT domain-containing protein [Streptosporangiaceae bacterium]|nr:NACHT domain-containing protein [Streptosporangiaceae bacterium]
MTGFVAVAGVMAIVLVKHTHDPDYWISGAALLLPMVLAVAGKIRRPAGSPTAGQIGEEAAKLRDSVLQQWSDEVEFRISVYPLQVPFSAAAQVTGPVTVQVPGGEPENREVTVPVMDSWAAILRDPDRRPPRMDGTFGSIAGIFRAGGLPGRLVVLGEPGSGKSVLAQSLTVDLLRGRPAPVPGDSVPGDAVPVLLPLATWDPGVPLRDWAAVQIARTYPWLATQIQVRGGAGRTLAGWLLDQGRVLMVLDGLDEVAAENRLTAFRGLSEAASKNQPMVITCRTREYAQIVHDAGQPMPRTPVIRLDPLPLSDVRAYLIAAGQRLGSGRAGQLADRLDAAPRGPLAEALRLPLALWLVTSVYRDAGSDPAELARCQSRGEVLRHLLAGLVTAAYEAPVGDYPAREHPATEAAHRRLTKIAAYLGPDPQSQNIDWWRLPDQVPRLFIGGLTGPLVGCAGGAAAGFAVAIRFGGHLGVPIGIIVGIVDSLLAVVTSIRRRDFPRTIDLRFRWDYWRFTGCLTGAVIAGLASGYADARHGGPIAGLIAAFATGPACAAVVMRAYGRAVGVLSGISAAVIFGMSCGLFAGNGQPALSGLLVGLVGAVSGWVIVGLFQPAQDRLAVTPRSLLDRDRVGTLTVAGTVGIGCGIVYGIALGPLAGAVVLAAAAVSLTATASVWGRFSISRVWMALTGMAPLAAMGFLAEAHARGVLRQVGGSYQFRHTELKEALLPAQEAGQASSADQPAPIATTPIEPLSMGGRQRDRGGHLPAGDRIVVTNRDVPTCSLPPLQSRYRVSAAAAVFMVLGRSVRVT